MLYVLRHEDGIEAAKCIGWEYVYGLMCGEALKRPERRDEEVSCVEAFEEHCLKKSRLIAYRHP